MSEESASYSGWAQGEVFPTPTARQDVGYPPEASQSASNSSNAWPGSGENASSWPSTAAAPPFDPATLAAFAQSAAASGFQLPGMPPSGWQSQYQHQRAPVPPAPPPQGNPASQTTPAPGTADPALAAAHTMLLAHHWATQMAMAHRQYSAMGYGGMPAWPEQPGVPPWPAGDVSSWPGNAQLAAAATAQAATGFSAEGNQSGPSATQGQKSETSSNSYALGLLEKMSEEEHESATEKTNAIEMDEEAKAITEDISDAVARFLAGGDDGFDESDSEPEVEEETAAPQPPAPPPQPPKSAPPPPTEHSSPTRSKVPVQLATAAFAAAGLVQSLPSNPVDQANGPTPEGVQDFLNVLRRRTLPAEIKYEENKQHITSVINQCVLSLYRDRITSIQNNVQRRLRERNCSEAMIQALLPLCARESSTYKILPPSASRLPIVLLINEPKWFEGFVDVESPDDTYSEDAWSALTSFLSDDDITLPSQAYQAALELRQLYLPHVQTLALGEIEHMVRLAMGKRKLLRHHGDSLKPTRVAKQLEAREKERRINPRKDVDSKKVSKANKILPAAKPVESDSGLGDITDSEDLAVVMLQLTQRFPDGVSLSLMKQHVQAHCKRNLNEAAFKCSKLTEIFKLAPLSSMFSLEQVPHRNEIIVKPPNYNAIPSHIWQKFYQLKEQGLANGKRRTSGNSDTGLSSERSWATNGKGSAASTTVSAQKLPPGLTTVDAVYDHIGSLQ